MYSVAAFVLLEQESPPVMTTIVPLSRMDGEKDVVARKAGEFEEMARSSGLELAGIERERSRVRRSMASESGFGEKM